LIQPLVIHGPAHDETSSMHKGLACVKGRYAQALDRTGGSGFFLGSAARENSFVKVPVTQNKIHYPLKNAVKPKSRLKSGVK
jgi:hypothetical protein